MDEKNWNSVKDGLPKKDGKYLCTVNCFGVYNVVETVSFANNLSKAHEFDFYGCNRAGWYNYDSEYGQNYEETNVLAWMELPKPYVEK